jgi:hypothetical protein
MILLKNADEVVVSENTKNEASEHLAREIDKSLRRLDALATLDLRPEDEILSYGEDGMPR